MRPTELTCEEMDAALIALLDYISADILEAYVPLYRSDDREELVSAMPAFNDQGLEPSDHPNSLVMLSSGNNGYKEDSEETEDNGLEKASPRPSTSFSAISRTKMMPTSPRPRTPRALSGSQGRRSPLHGRCEHLAGRPQARAR